MDALLLLLSFLLLSNLFAGITFAHHGRGNECLESKLCFLMPVGCCQCSTATADDADAADAVPSTATAADADATNQILTKFLDAIPSLPSTKYVTSVGVSVSQYK